MLDKLLDRLIPSVKADAACVKRCVQISYDPNTGCYTMRCYETNCTYRQIRLCE
ncbi:MULTISPECIES: hypothetical protein [unclassified Nonomuraea]|uniref:hypothetical protein n=1 Tax=unclassified Nonomuraea TaxID=2593643 RepID=UPI001378BC68|nr:MULTISPECIES: hypothetical protein [unclassified Nonomuraea]NBE95296.1 hypothetical protein [Nonomuraea sp. K271]